MGGVLDLPVLALLAESGGDCGYTLWRGRGSGVMELDKKYRNELMLALRLHDISGRRVGDVLAEVETHVAETGEDPVDAFGEPREYAAEVAAALGPGGGKPSTLVTLGGALGTGATTLFGISFLIEGLTASGSAVAVTLGDVVSLPLMLVVIAAGLFFFYRAATTGTNRGLYGAAGVCAVLAAIGLSAATGRYLHDVAPLFELPRWVSVGLGGVLLAGAVTLVVRGTMRGWVVDPRR